MKRDDSVYLHHILDAIVKIKEYVKDIEQESFYFRCSRQYWVWVEKLG